MAEFRAAAIFSHNMVLQRRKNIRIFGKGTPKEKVLATLGEALTECIVQENGTWNLFLPPMEAEENMTLCLTSQDEELRFKNIAIGEVWLAGGQSNMEMELQNVNGGIEELTSKKHPKVRFYYTQKNSFMDQSFYEAEEKTCWTEFDREDSKVWSAAGYFFAKNLYEKLHVTVGIIGCNWGGTSASAWTDPALLEKDEDLRTYVDEYHKAVGDKTIEEQIKEYDTYASYQPVWDQKMQEMYANNPDITWDEIQQEIGICQYPGPMNCKNPMRPGGLYECMLKRVAPYTLGGFLYYQGESDDHKPQFYEKLLGTMIFNWRRLWMEDTLPFLLVQLPMHRFKQDPDWKNWCLIREAQMSVFRSIKNTGIAIITEHGEFNEIHPKEKRPVGERLALQALYHVYHKIKDVEAFGPMFRDLRYEKDYLELFFDYAEEGFDIRNQVSGFEIAGADQNYVTADVVMTHNSIILSAAGLRNPLYARYLWTNYGEVTVFGKNGIPLAPFRTSK